MASIGLNEKRDQKASVEYRVIEELFDQNDRALAEGEPGGKIKLPLNPQGKFLGCQIIGRHAGELSQEWVAMINGGVKLSTMAGAVHIYPILSEISKRISGRPFSEKLFGEKTKGILKFLFHFKGRACTPLVG